MVHITRRECFSAAHKLYNESWTKEQNDEVFGKCANPNWHGHNYIVYVTVKGKVKPETGYAANLKTISNIIKEFAIDKLDHKNLNLDVDFMQGVMPSTENLAKAIWEQIAEHIENLGCKMHCVKLCETENNYVEYFGEE